MSHSGDRSASSIRCAWYAQPRTWIEFLVVLAFVIAILDYSSTYSLWDKLERTPASPTTHIGLIAHDKNFSIAVQNMQCTSELNLKGSHEIAPARSQWCLATLYVSRTKSTPGEFELSSQTAITASGDQLPVDDAALNYIPIDGILAPKTNMTSDFAMVEPGVVFKAILPFLTLRNDPIRSLHLDHTIFDTGITIDVTQR